MVWGVWPLGWRWGQQSWRWSFLSIPWSVPSGQTDQLVRTEDGRKGGQHTLKSALVSAAGHHYKHAHTTYSWLQIATVVSAAESFRVCLIYSAICFSPFVLPTAEVFPAEHLFTVHQLTRPFVFVLQNSQSTQNARCRTLAPKSMAIIGNIRCLWLRLCKCTFHYSRMAYGRAAEKVGVAFTRRMVERLNNKR